MIREIAHRINEISKDYEIGKLQNIRTEIKKLQRRPGSNIFHESTIDKNDEWAFHYGGRKELQFNIGLEDAGFRYGIALSLEASHTLPDISILYPKAKRLNQFINQYPKFFDEYKMWFYQQDNGRSRIGPVRNISDDLLKQHTFIFIGKLHPENEIDFNDILKTFDDLLKPYIFVERDDESIGIEHFEKENGEFNFEAKSRRLPKIREYSLEEKSVNLTVRHSLLQEKLLKNLAEKYGYNNVSSEHPIDGKKIDVVLRNGNSISFYEIKMNGSAKACIRDAIGQLMEYAYWPNRKNADQLIVIGEGKIDQKTTEYVKSLRENYNLPIQYETLTID